MEQAALGMLNHSLQGSITGAQIADVWKITVQGAAGIAQLSIKQDACGGGQTMLRFRLTIKWLEWTGMKTSEARYRYNTYKLACRHGASVVLIPKRSAKSRQVGPASMCSSS